jgi:hypothetical protein
MVRDARPCRAPHHEDLTSCRRCRPHPEEAANRGRLEGWATKLLQPRVLVPATNFARAVHRSYPPKTEGTGKAGWPLHPGLPRKRDLRERVNHRYRRIHSGLPRAVVYGLYELSSVNQRLPPSPSRSFQLREDLAPAWARQNRTTSPSAPMPHVSSIFASTAFRSTLVTIAIRPLCRCGTGAVNHNLRKHEIRIFLI